MVFDSEGRVIRVVLGEKVSCGHVDLEVMALLKKYFSGDKVDLSGISVVLDVPSFTRRVLEEVRFIGWGRVVTYKELAERVGIKSCRAVGQALRLNPVPVIVPCHRVIGSDGSLKGFSSGIEWKKYLLNIEGVKLP